MAKLLELLWLLINLTRAKILVSGLDVFDGPTYNFYIFEDAYLLCFYGTSQKYLSWIGPHNEVINFNNSKYSEKAMLGGSRLGIHNLTESDFGVYKCRGSSGKEVHMKLNILGKIINLKENYTLPAGKPGLISFIVRGKPQPQILLWKEGKDGSIVIAEFKDKGKQSGDSHVKIIPEKGIYVTNIKLSDEGSYEVEISTNGNYQKAKFYLNISQAKPIIIKEVSTKDILFLGKRDVLPVTCVAEGKPVPSLYLYNGPTKLDCNKTENIKLYRKKVTWSYQVASSIDIANLTCISENSHGSAVHTIFMKEIRVPSEPRDVQVTVSGNKIQIDWVKPLNNGGDSIINYNVTYCSRSTEVCHVQETKASTAAVLTDLDFSTNYLVYVTAHNRRGSGKAYSVEVEIGIKVPLDIVLPITIVVLAAVAIFFCFCCYFRAQRAKRRRQTAAKR